ncbi:hypothetical protein PTKIN_Ptkin12aG0213900 [Pterospermum kingtungense]
MQSQRGSKPYLTPKGRRKNKIQRDRDYRLRKRDGRRKLLENYKELEEALEEVKEKHSGIASLQEELSKVNAGAVKLAKKLLRDCKTVKGLRMAKKTLETEIQQLQQKILDDQLKDLDENQLVPESSKSKGIMEGSLIGEGTSLRLPPVVVNVEGFSVLKENSMIIQKILSQHPNIASGLQLKHPSSKSLVMNQLAEVYKTARQEKHTLEEIKRMETNIRDMEFVGLDVSWLKAMVVECQKVVELKEKVRRMKAELQLLEEASA